MNKTKFLTLMVVVLALLNAVTLTVLWKRPPRRPHPEGPRKIIIEQLHFDKEQVAAYDVLVEKHREGIRQKDLEMAKARQAIYQQLRSDDYSKSDSLLAEVGRLQIAVEQIHLTHFQGIRKLCRTEQLPDFEQLTGELEQLFGKPKRPKKQ